MNIPENLTHLSFFSKCKVHVFMYIIGIDYPNFLEARRNAQYTV